MNQVKIRVRAAGRAAALHLLSSVVVAAIVAVLIFNFWYPYPYQELSGGRELLFLVIAVDIVCGPLLTLVLFDKRKTVQELSRDIGLVVLIQLAALTYGVWTVWQARPLFLAFEIDRFKVIAAPDLEGAPLSALPEALRPSLTSGPRVVALRPPVDEQERHRVLIESVLGGRDYGERPEFYIPYEGAAAQGSTKRAKTLAAFVERYPEQAETASHLTAAAGIDVKNARYLPVMGRQDWVAVLDPQGRILGFLKGDGF